MSEKQIAVITGGTSGIGLQAAAIFLERGYQTVLIGSTEEKGAAALKEFPTGECLFLRGNIAIVSECARLAKEIELRYGKADVLINSAGIYMEQAIEKMTEEAFNYLMDINCKGTYFMCKYFVPLLKKGKNAAIVNLSSDAGINGNFLCTAYCASKGAVTVFTKALALELAPYNIRVNAVCPGDIDTPMTERQLAGARDRQEALKAMSEVYPMGRIGTAREAAEVVAFLASEKASFVTGAVWSVDGGVTAY